MELDVPLHFDAQFLLFFFETEESKNKDIRERIFTQYRKEYKSIAAPKYEYISNDEKKRERNSGVVYNRKDIKRVSHCGSPLED